MQFAPPSSDRTSTTTSENGSDPKKQGLVAVRDTIVLYAKSLLNLDLLKWIIILLRLCRSIAAGMSLPSKIITIGSLVYRFGLYVSHAIKNIRKNRKNKESKEKTDVL